MRIAKRFLLTLICLLALGVCVQAAGQTGTITLHFSGQDGPMSGVPFVSDSDRVALTTDTKKLQDFFSKGIEVPSLETAGPRETIFHDPAWTRAGIVTCGGLCPGLNNVIKSLVTVLWFDYGVRNIFGIGEVSAVS